MVICSLTNAQNALNFKNLGLRIKATSIALPEVGLYIIGGFKQLTTELLPLGADNWIPGPVLPGDDETSYYGICSVLVTPTKFMVIGGDGEGMFGGTRIQVINSKKDFFCFDMSWFYHPLI